jgi:serine/threonine-protein kinase
MADDAPRLPPGSPYRLIDRIGAGAMGEVWRARDESSGADLVVKVMKAQLPAGLADRLRLEAQALGKITHPNVVRVFDSGTTADNRPFLVMELLVGRPLDELLRERGAFPIPQALSIARQLAAALARVHEAGIVHRDVKPPNVFVCDDGTVKLLDFGVIKLVEKLTGVAPLQVPTHHGAAIGTPSFMSPEQALAKQVDGKADVYGAGLVLYLMLTGAHPFARHKQLKDMLIAHVKEMPPPPSQVAPQAIPESLDRLVLAAVAKSQDDRLTAGDLLRELTAVEQSIAGAAPASSREPSGEAPTRAMPVHAAVVHATALPPTAPPPQGTSAPALPFVSPPPASSSQPSNASMPAPELDMTPPPVSSAPEPPSVWHQGTVRVAFWIAALLGFVAGLAVLGRMLVEL